MRYPSRTRDGRIGRRDALLTALIVSALFCGPLVYGTNFDGALHAKLRSVLGEEPDGLGFDLYIFLFAFPLAVPMIFFLYRTLITLTYAKRYQASMVHAGNIGAAVGLIGHLRSLVKDTGEAGHQSVEAHCVCRDPLSTRHICLLDLQDG